MVNRSLFALGVLLVFVSLAILAKDPETKPKHLQEAVVLVKNLNLADTQYNHGGPRVEWKGVDKAEKFASYTDCSGFMDALLTHTYGYDKTDFKKWFGKNRPTANVYHDTIVDQKGFRQIFHLEDARPGDVLAVKYLIAKHNTGHLMLLEGTPKKAPPTKPLIDGTDQWLMTIIDSSESGHGPTDTRHKQGENGKDHPGLGKGILRIYTHKGGKHPGEIAGWTWSTLGLSEFKEPNAEHLVIGRLKSDYKP